MKEKPFMNDYHKKRSEEAMKAVEYFKKHPLSKEEQIAQLIRFSSKNGRKF